MTSAISAAYFHFRLNRVTSMGSVVPILGGLSESCQTASLCSSCLQPNAACWPEAAVPECLLSRRCWGEADISRS